MKLERFKKNQKKRNTLLTLGLMLIILGGGIILYRSYALYQEEKTYNVLKGKVGNFIPNDIELSMTLDGETVSEVPIKQRYKSIDVTCDNGATGEWDTEKWGVTVTNINNVKTKCAINFETLNTVIVTVHGAVQETIRLSDGQTITTDATGTGTAEVQIGETYILTGSVSEYTSEEQVVEDTTTDLYAMPLGLVIYWYGNKCTDVTGGWVYASYAQRETYTASSSPSVFNWNTNSLLFGFKNLRSGGGGVRTINEIDITGYTKINGIWGLGSYFTINNSSNIKYYGKNSNSIGFGKGTSRIIDDSNRTYWYSCNHDANYSDTTIPTINRLNLDMRTPEGSYYLSVFESIAQSNYVDYVTEVHAIWLE